MTMQNCAHCDGPGCDVHRRHPATAALAGAIPQGWILMRTSTKTLTFHAAPCAMEYLRANPTPPPLLTVTPATWAAPEGSVVR